MVGILLWQYKLLQLIWGANKSFCFIQGLLTWLLSHDFEVLNYVFKSFGECLCRVTQVMNYLLDKDWSIIIIYLVRLTWERRASQLSLKLQFFCLYLLNWSLNNCLLVSQEILFKSFGVVAWMTWIR